MEHQLFGYYYEDDSEGYEGEQWITIWQQKDNNQYGVVVCLGNVNITRRIFIKQVKHPHKIHRYEENSIIIDKNKNLKELDVLFTEIGCSETLISDIKNVVITQSNNKLLKCNNHNRIGGENDGIVNF